MKRFSHTGYEQSLHEDENGDICMWEDVKNEFILLRHQLVCYEGIKRCPFCGGAAEYLNEDPICNVKCGDCGATGAYFVDDNGTTATECKILAIKAWNKRMHD